MSADTLREAARLMRERAESIEVGDDWWAAHALTWLQKTSGTPMLAEHIASWHPDVALAVADCLDAAARVWPPDPHEPREGCPDCSWLAVARAFLGETS